MDFDNDFYDDIHFRQYRIIEQDYEANAFFRNLHFAFTILIMKVETATMLLVCRRSSLKNCSFLWL